MYLCSHLRRSAFLPGSDCSLDNVDAQDILEVLKSVKYPGYMRDIVSFGLVKNVAVNGGAVSVSMQLTGGTAHIAAQIKAAAEKAVRAAPGVERIGINIRLAGEFGKRFAECFPYDP